MLKKIAAHYAVPVDWLINGTVENARYDNTADAVKATIEVPVAHIIMQKLQIMPKDSQYKVLGFIECMCMANETIV